MARRKRNTQNNNEIPPIKIEELKILRVKDFDNFTAFDFEINGIRIYGARIIEGRNGDFIAFPANKGKDGNFYNHVWFKMDDETQKKIIEAVDNFEA